MKLIAFLAACIVVPTTAALTWRTCDRETEVRQWRQYTFKARLEGILLAVPLLLPLLRPCALVHQGFLLQVRELRVILFFFALAFAEGVILLAFTEACFRSSASFPVSLYARITLLRSAAA